LLYLRKIVILALTVGLEARAFLFITKSASSSLIMNKAVSPIERELDVNNKTIQSLKALLGWRIY